MAPIKFKEQGKVTIRKKLRTPIKLPEDYDPYLEDDYMVDFYKEVYDLQSYQFMYSQKLMDKYPNVFFRNVRIVSADFNQEDIIDRFEKMFDKDNLNVHCHHKHGMAIDIIMGTGAALVWYNFDEETFTHSFNMWASKRSYLNQIEDELQAAFKGHTEVLIRWYYDPRRLYYKNVFLTNIPDVKDEYYPFIPKGVNFTFEDYEKSTSTVLLLVGPPGTGKTSFLRSYIKNQKKKAIVSYDEAILSSDGFMLQLVTDDEIDLLVIEDADLLLTSREKDKNEIMSKLLNVSDGLIKLPQKKIVFTTNINDINKVDEALMRPGRCYGVINFRELSFEEAKVAAKAAGVAEPTKEKKYTLSDLFNQNLDKVSIKKIGFV